MTVQEAAKLLEVKPTVVYELCARRLLGHRRIGIGRGVIRITQADIDAYLASCRVEPRQPQPAERPNGTGLAVRSILGELRAEEERKRALGVKRGAPRARPRASGRSGSALDQGKEGTHPASTPSCPNSTILSASSRRSVKRHRPTPA